MQGRLLAPLAHSQRVTMLQHSPHALPAYLGSIAQVMRVQELWCLTAQQVSIAQEEHQGWRVTEPVQLATIVQWRHPFREGAILAITVGPLASLCQRVAAHAQQGTIASLVLRPQPLLTTPLVRSVQEASIVL